MLTTFIIALREGLEAALIVSIIATFLRKAGHSLRAMWIGVVLAVIASIAVGVGLLAIETSLPQAAQEGMETIIGVIAVGFVTGMVLWMSTHARGLKRELEHSTADALNTGTTSALALMAFLAVLREGFESAVFLLATLTAARDPWAAGGGTVLGFALAVALGVGLYRGAVRLDIGKLFRYSGVLLVLVAAGLTLSALRTAHEAGWINGGQQQVLDLSWLSPNGSIRSALITGVLGIPADPRLIETVGWFAYLIPMLLLIVWPAKRRPSAAIAARLRWGCVLALMVAAVALLVAWPRPAVPGGSAPLLTSDGSASGTARLTRDNNLVVDGISAPVVLTDGGTEAHAGLSSATVRHGDADVPAPADAPATLTLEQLRKLNGGRLPVGINPTSNPGPFNAAWKLSRHVDAWTRGSSLLDAQSHTSATLVLSGGGLPTPRTQTVSGDDIRSALPGLPRDFHVAPAHVESSAAALRALPGRQNEALLWSRQLPVLMLLGAAALAMATVLRGRRAVAGATAVKPPAATAAPEPPTSPTRIALSESR